MLLRLVMGAIIPLFPDETYYWDWSRTLKAGYFDHPPAIAVLIRAGTTMFGQHPFGVRFFPILAGGAAALGLTFTARELAGSAAARLATLAFACLPLAAVGLVLATPDSPMLCAVAWAMFCVVRALNARAVDGNQEVLVWWLAAGVAMGLAMSSKYTSVLVPAAIGLAFIGHPRLQNMFGVPGPYLAVVVASLVLAPVLWWNATHDWVSFRFQLSHGLGPARGGAVGAVNRVAELIGGQIGLVSPILFFFLARAVKRAFEPTPDGVRITLATIAACCAAFFLFSATRHSVEANWPAVAYLPAIALLASDQDDSPLSRRWLNRGLGLGALLSLIIITHALVPILPLAGTSDQVAKAFGWDLLAHKFDQRREMITRRASFGRGDLFLGAERYQDASELAFHLGDHPRVFSLNLVGRPNQYDLWGTFPERAAGGASLLLVLDDERVEPRVIYKLSCCFQSISQGESVALVRGENVSARKRIWYLEGWNGSWPRRDQPFPWVE